METLLTVFGRRGALRRVRSQVVPRVGVLMHRREGVGPQCGPRTAEPRWVHGRMVMAWRSSSGLGPSLVEVVRRGVVMLAVRRCSRRPDGVVCHPRVLLQLDKRRLVYTSDASSSVRGCRTVRRRRSVLVRRRWQPAATRQMVMVVVVVPSVVESVRGRHASCWRRCI